MQRFCHRAGVGIVGWRQSGTADVSATLAPRDNHRRIVTRGRHGRVVVGYAVFSTTAIESAAATDSANASLTLYVDLTESGTLSDTCAALNSITRPSSDVTTTGWTATPGPDLFDMIDEVTASDTDYITSPDLTSGASTTIHGLTQSLAVGTYTVRFRSEKATAPTRSVRIHLMDGTSTIVGSSGWQAVTASYALYEVSITTSALATRVGIEAQ